MRYLVLADIHSNLEALQAVLQHTSYDHVLLLGDLVGYGADPDPTVEQVRRLDILAAVRGNHDKVVAGIEQGETFTPRARKAALWSRTHINAENLQYLRELPAGPVAVDSLVSIAHGSPIDEDEYVVPFNAAGSALFKGFSTPICFFGHTHVPTVLYKIGSAVYPMQVERPTVMELASRSTRYMINPGAVGQPRDGDPRAAFLVFDTDAFTVEFFRVNYNVARAQEKIRQAGLPDYLAERLARGT